MITIKANDLESEIIINSLKMRLKILRRNYYYQKDKEIRKLIIERMKHTNSLMKKIDYILISTAMGDNKTNY